MLKVLQISQNYHIHGGSDVMFFSTMELLENNGHRVIPFAADQDQNLPTDWSQYFPPAADFESPGPRDVMRYVYSQPARKAITRLIERESPDIAHLHIYYGKLTGSILKPLHEAGIPTVQSVHEYKLICPVYRLVSNDHICEACRGTHFWQALPRRCNRRSFIRTALTVTESYVTRWLGDIENVDHFITASDFVANKLARYSVPAGKITRIHNFTPAGNTPPEPEPGDFFLYFGRIERLKGLWTLIEAAGPSGIPVKIVGQGEEEAALRAYVHEKKWDHIQFVPFQTQSALSEIIQGSIATVLPSEWYEPFGMTILESFREGVPVIGSAIGGIPEVIRNEVDGLLFEPGDVPGLQKAMQRMLEDRNLVNRMGRAGYRRLREYFSPDRYYRELMAIYEQVLDPVYDK